MDRLEKKRKMLVDRILAATDLITSGQNVTYVICARFHDEETDKVLTGINTNLSFKDPRSGELHPPTLGMMTDILMEAMLDNPDMEIKEKLSEAVNRYKN